MGFFSFLTNKKDAPTWKGLTSGQRAGVAKKIKALAGPRYKIVSGFDQTQREPGQVEASGEDSILDVSSRGRLLDMTRNAARNSATFQAILKQLDFNVCGSKAGKVILSLPDEGLAAELKARFAEWTRCADFFDGLSFNHLLKLILKTELIGGDCVLLFDDELVEDSGKLLVYEPDEIGDVPADALRSKFGKKAWQSLGKVYSRNGRFIGATVSRSCRGMPVFDPGKCYFLKRDPDSSWLDCKWLMPQNFYRAGQGRGVSQAAASIATILDLEDLCGFELQAAKKNSQTFAQITRASGEAEEQPPSAFDQSASVDDMDDREIEAAAKEEAAQGEQVISLQRAQSAGILFEQLPDDYKMELLQTAHPNEKVRDFVTWLAGRASSAFGMSEAYATLSPDANFRAHQLMTAPAFKEAQKSLEQVCDWAFWRFCRKLEARGEVALPGNFMQHVAWQWPGIDELDETSHQTAVEMKLRNLTGTLRDELGSDWKASLMQSKEELEFCRKNGLPHPAMQMISGGMRGEFGESRPAE